MIRTGRTFSSEPTMGLAWSNLVVHAWNTSKEMMDQMSGVEKDNGHNMKK